MLRRDFLANIAAILGWFGFDKVIKPIEEKNEQYPHTKYGERFVDTPRCFKGPEKECYDVNLTHCHKCGKELRKIWRADVKDSFRHWTKVRVLHLKEGDKFIYSDDGKTTYGEWEVKARARLKGDCQGCGFALVMQGVYNELHA